MTAFAKNYDGICFLLRHDLSAQKDVGLKGDLDRLTSAISELVRSKRKIRYQSITMLDQVFNLRVKALKWLLANRRFTLSEMFNGTFSKMEELKSDKRLEVLADNVLFALRCNQRVAESMIVGELSEETFGSVIPDITYSQFVTSIALTSFGNEITQKIIDLTNASLHIEFGLFAADIIHDEKEKVTDKTIDGLAFLVADAAQTYSALAVELGLLKLRTVKHSFTDSPLEANFMGEQKELADLGLDDFALNFVD